MSYASKHEYAFAGSYYTSFWWNTTFRVFNTGLLLLCDAQHAMLMLYQLLSAPKTYWTKYV